MPVKFYSHRCANIAQPLTVEEIFRLYGTWSGLEEFSFDSKFEDDSLSLNGSGGTTWHTTLQSGTLPLDYAISYHKTDYRQGVAVGDSGGVHYLVTTEEGYVTVYRGMSESYTAVQRLPIDTSEEADVTVCFRHVRYGEETDLWRVISLYINDKHITTYSEPVRRILENTQFGFSVYGSDSVTYTNIRIPELTEFAEWGTLDPGEEAASGLARVLEGRYLKYFARFDGSLRAWRPKSKAVDHTFSEELPFRQSASLDVSQLVTHLRMMGAYTWAEAIDPDLIAKYGHRFKEDNNPMLMTEKECHDEAERSIKRRQEMAETFQVTTPFTPLLEPEDRISANDADWLVGEIGLEFLGGAIRQSLNCKTYVWG